MELKKPLFADGGIVPPGAPLIIDCCCSYRLPVSIVKQFEAMVAKHAAEHPPENSVTVHFHVNSGERS